MFHRHLCDVPCIQAMFLEELNLWYPQEDWLLVYDRQTLLPYFLFTGSKVETPATATVMTARTTPPATTLNSKFFKDGLIPGWAASAISGTTAAANKAKPVRPVKSCSFCVALSTIKLHTHTHTHTKWNHEPWKITLKYFNRDPIPRIATPSMENHRDT